MRRTAIIATLALTALVGACGTGGPQARFTEAVGDVCAAHREAARLGSLEGVARTRAARASQLRSLDRLVPPRGDEEQVERWVTQLRENVAALRRLERALRRRDRRAARAAETAFRDGEFRAGELVRAYGVTRCDEG